VFTWLGRIPLKSLAKSRLRSASTATHVIDVALRPDGPATWSAATIVNDRPMVRLCADVNVVNTSDTKVILISAKLKKPATEGLIRVHDPRSGTTQTRALDPFASACASVFFFVPISPPPAGTTVVADVGLVDQFGNTHWLEKVRFRGRALDECDYF
jgi:hypothetical protein